MRQRISHDEYNDNVALPHDDVGLGYNRHAAVVMATTVNKAEPAAAAAAAGLHVTWHLHRYRSRRRPLSHQVPDTAHSRSILKHVQIAPPRLNLNYCKHQLQH